MKRIYVMRDQWIEEILSLLRDKTALWSVLAVLYTPERVNRFVTNWTMLFMQQGDSVLVVCSDKKRTTIPYGTSLY